MISNFHSWIPKVGSMWKVYEPDADSLQMHQLFQNLIGNALKFHRPDIPPVIKIYTENGGNFYCCIIVEDNGIGFTTIKWNRIFEPFVRLHSMEHYEGSGMGLAICKKIVERHGQSRQAVNLVSAPVL